MLKHIPNLLTLSNLLFGCLAIICVIKGDLGMAAGFIMFSGIADFLDGLLARALNAFSEMGKQLDSLADLVSFGVAPAMILFSLISESALAGSYAFVPYLSLCLPMAACWRLAKFNLSEDQAHIFSGLPSPAAGILGASFAFVHKPVWFQDIFNPDVFVVISIVLSLLMISSIKMFSLKFKNTSWGENAIRYVFLILCIPVFYFVGFSFTVIPLILILYIILAAGSAITGIEQK